MSDKGLPFSAAKTSLKGDRATNQDRCFFFGSDDTLMLGLGDGLGGHPRGEVAAQLLTDVCETMFRAAPKPLPDPEDFLVRCIGKAHQAILRFGRRQEPRISPRTTAVLAIVQRGMLYWVHVGDSRLYLIRNHVALHQTQDHAHIQFIRPSADQPPRARSSLTRCIGGLVHPPKTTCGSPTILHRDDTLLLCSDGLWGQLAPNALIEGFGSAGLSVQEQVDRLAEAARRMPHSDNITAIALRWHNDAELSAAEITRLSEDDQEQLDHAIKHLEDLIAEAQKSSKT